MKTFVRKWGNSLGVRIPKMVAEELHLEDGSEVEVSRKEGGILISPGAKKNLKKKLELVTPDNIHDESDTGAPAGKETW